MHLVTDSSSHNGEKFLTLTEHLEELRWRLIRSVIAILVGFVIAWIFRHDLLFLVKEPLLQALPEEARHTVLLRVMDRFFVDIKLAFYGALFLAAPYIMAEAWGFLAPGLYKHERNMILPFFLGSLIFFVIGVLFCYVIVLPLGMTFLVSYSTDSSGLLLTGQMSESLQSANDLLQVSLKEYVGFAATLLLVFGVAFELPLVLSILSMFGLVNTEMLRRNRKYAVVLTVVVGALLTPPDPMTQISLAIPLYMLYELSIWASHLIEKFRRRS